MSLDDDTPAGRVCKLRYDEVRKSILRRHTWNFAIKRIILSPKVSTPAFEYSHEFTLPGDFIRIVQIYGLCKDDWRVEGDRTLLANTDTIKLRYVYNITDLTFADDLFVQAFEYALAADIGRRMTESDTVVQQMEDGFERTIKKARSTDASDEPPLEIQSNWIYEARVASPGRGYFPRDAVVGDGDA